MKRKKTIHLHRIIVYVMFLVIGISSKQVEAKLNTGNVKVTSQRLSSATDIGGITTWTVSQEHFIPLGSEVSLCWDDIGMDLNETEPLQITITNPNGTEYAGPAWSIHNHYVYPGTTGTLGWRYITGPGHDSYGTISTYFGPFSEYDIDVAAADKGVKFVGYAAITFSESDPTGLYTGTIKIGDEELTTSWYMIDQPINIKSNLMDQSLNAGDTATFEVTATGTNLSYQWYYNTVDSYEGGKAIAGATDASYTIDKALTEYDGRYYYCQVSNYSADDTYRKVTKYSSRAYLTVKGDPVVTPITVTDKKTKAVKKLNLTGKLLSVKSKTKRKIIIKWKKLKGITGYQIHICKDKRFRKSVIRREYKAKKQSVKISNLLSGKKYYVRLRPYKNEKGSVIYGKWSKVKKTKVK